MSFLNQLKSQASALQAERERQDAGFEQNCQVTERACQLTWHYLQEVARQLNVIAPPSPRLSLDGKTAWPPMKMVAFRTDARKKSVRQREVFDFVAMGWEIVPQSGGTATGSVTVNFPPDLERVESRLAGGWVKHERVEIRHPEKNTLQALRFDYVAATRANITVSPDHEKGQLAFRLANISGFGTVMTQHRAQEVTSQLLDELAKMIVGQANQFR